MSLYTRIPFFCLCIICAFSADAQVVAGFTATPSSGCAPLIVSFSNTSTPVTGTTYSWDFDNGTGVVTLTNPSTSYLSAGTYTVTLTATNGGVSNIHTQVITVYPQPAVSFTASDTAQCPGASFTFTSTSTAGMPGALSYLWSFGDGYTATTSPATHPYGLPGRFNISLTATNAAGCSNTLAQPSLIHVYTPPVSLFSASTQHICKHSGSVTFTSAPSGTSPFTYRWDFGDGSATSLTANPIHFYAAPGNYAARLVVTDTHGCMDSLVRPAYITVTGLTASFTGPDSTCVNTPVTFVNTSLNYLSSRWYYSGGKSSTTVNGYDTFQVYGKDTATLVAADSFCYDTATHVVNVPISHFSCSPLRPCPAPITATLNATTPAGSTIYWDFGDTHTGAGSPATHLYNNNGVYYQRMFVVTPWGCTDTFLNPYGIYDFNIHPFPVASGPKGGCAPLTVGFSQTDPMDPPYHYLFKYAFDFGDGSPVDTLPHDPPVFHDINMIPSTLHTFVTPGLFPVKVTLISENGCLGIAYDTVPVGSPKQATFTATPRHLCYNNNLVTFTRTLVSDTADGYFWMFGEGNQGYKWWDTSRKRVDSYAYHFAIPDTAFSDTLITYYHGCPDTFIQHNYIRIDSPRARAIRTVICSPPKTVFFKSISIGADSVKWFFGDGTTSRLDSVNHTFPLNAVYTTTLTAYNIRSGCRDTQLIYIDLTKPTINLTASDTTLCKGDYALFSARAVSGETAAYQWLIGGHHSYNITYDMQPIFADTFTVPGRYTLKLVVFDQNTCTDTITKNNYVLVAQPVSSITAAPPGLCAPQTTTFTDISTDQPGVTIVNHVWLFGDGDVAASATPSIAHTYTAAGSYRVTEFVTDNLGCFDSANIIRTLYGTRSSFSAPARTCGKTGVPFTNTSGSANYLWLFGDGYTSTVVNPVHAFADTGNYNVRLVAIDPHGCRDTSSHIITVIGPHAAFSMSDSVGICPPLTVRFTNLSLRASTYFWNFGNGTSIIANPVDVFTAPGFDTVLLIITDSFGCHDTFSRHIKVFGYNGAFTYNVDSGCIPLAVTLNANLSNIALASAIRWDFGDGITSPPSLTDTVTHSYTTAGPYVPKLIISDHSGCVSSSTGRDTIKVDIVRPGFLASPDTVCIRNRIHFADTSKSYWSHINRWRWVIGGGISSTDTTSAVFAAPGTYTAILHMTDAWGCSADDSQSISVYALPAISPAVLLCAGQTGVLSDSVTGGVWSSGAPAMVSVGSISGAVTGMAAGVANITYTTGGNCYTTVAVTVAAYPDSGIISGDSVLCVGASVQLAETVSGGVWSLSNGNASISLSGTLNGIAAGLDTVRYTVNNTVCSSSAKRSVMIFPLPDPGAISGKDTICVNVATTLGETNSRGRWSSGYPSIATIDSDGRVYGLTAGNVIITFTTGPDSNGCSNVATFPVIIINTDMSVTPAVTGVKCYSEHNGSIALTIAGTPPYAFMWSTGDTTSSIDSLGAGAYTITVSEPATNCTLQQSFTVPSPDSLKVRAELISDVCERPNGSIKLTPQGGTQPYRFMWSNKSVTAEINSIPSGLYSCTITDVNGCMVQYTTMLIDSTCPDIVIHDGISPNGDGINDTWVIEGLWRYSNNVVKIFDKWGDELFEESDYKNDWNGTGSKGALPDGTYYYLVKLNSPNPPNGKDVYAGAILIKR